MPNEPQNKFFLSYPKSYVREELERRKSHQSLKNFTNDDVRKTNLNEPIGEDGRIDWFSRTAWAKIQSNAVKRIGDSDDIGFSKNNQLFFHADPADFNVTNYVNPLNTPSPILTSVDVEHHGRFGMLRKCTFSFTCYSREQFDKLQSIYLTPGTYILVQWGWSDTKKETTETLDLYKLKDKNDAYKSVRKFIDDGKGMHDALLGIVSDFNVTLGEDGTIQCTSTLNSAGAMTVDILLDNKTKSIGKDFVRFAERNLFEFGQNIRFDERSSRIESNVNDRKWARFNTIQTKTGLDDETEIDLIVLDTPDSGVRRQRVDEAKEFFETGDLFIRWDWFERLLNEYFPSRLGVNETPFIWSSKTPFNTVDDIDKYNIPVFNPTKWANIPAVNDWNKQKVTSLWRSFRPSDVIIPNTPSGGWVQDTDRWTTPQNGKSERKLSTFNSGVFGNLAHVWVNWNSVVRQSFFTNDSIQSALTSILNILNDASGGMWDLQLLMNGLDGRCWRVMDINIGFDDGDKSNKISDQYLSFDYYTKSGVLSNVNITMNLPNALKTTMMIAANADDLDVEDGSNKTVDESKFRALRGMLNGWSDRWRQQKSSNDSNISNASSKWKQEINKAIIGVLQKAYFQQPTPNEKKHSIALIRETQSKMKSESSFFNIPIPLDVSLTLEGLSGLEWGNGFVVKNLPSRYDNNDVVFQIKNVKHTIDEGGWNTEIDSVMRVNPKATIQAGDNIDWTRYQLNDEDIKIKQLENTFTGGAQASDYDQTKGRKRVK